MVLTYPINHGGNSSFIKSSSSLSNKSSNPILPPFLITAVDCHLCITINVKHVLPENFVMKFHPDSDASKIQCDFCNGATDYCLCLSFHSQSLFIINSPVVDVWDNNVTVQFELDFRTSCDSFEFELFSGWDWSILEQVKVDDVVREVKDSLKKKLKNEAPISMLPKPEDILTDVPNLKPETSQPLEGDQVEDDCRPTARSNDKTGRVGRSYSESSDDGSLSSTPNRGILKRRFKSRSYSESSFDELPFRESLPEITNEPSFGSYKEENVGSVDRSKKTVRFSNVVKEQIYRTNSSIVGQRKKNQRKAQCKKRKMSLSSSIESSDGEFMSQASKVKDLETEEKVHSDYAPHPPDCVDPGTKEQFEVIEQNEVELGESLDGTHINDSGVELDGEAQIEGKRESNKSKRKKGKGKKKNEITDLMFALEI
ncbi:protein kintoun-like [Artemia franciscana]|uniref:protein kintoun-like n=1 Tax=Artemia franciscana TaxID=6661 RepID=UPI0032DA3C9C